MRERHKTPTSYDSPSEGDKAALTELANFLYSEYEQHFLDNQPNLADDEDDGTSIGIEEAL